MYICLFKGINKEDITSLEKNFIQDNLLPDNEFDELIKDEQRELFNELPSKFIDLTLWPDNTNLLCWNCSLSFTGRPIPIPKEISYFKNEKHYKTMGNFCSFTCAYNYIINNIRNNTDKENSWRDIFLLKEIFPCFYPNVNQPKIFYKCPDKITMETYGGKITVLKFRKKIWNLEQQLINDTKIANNVYK